MAYKHEEIIVALFGIHCFPVLERFDGSVAMAQKFVGGYVDKRGISKDYVVICNDNHVGFQANLLFVLGDEKIEPNGFYRCALIHGPCYVAKFTGKGEKALSMTTEDVELIKQRSAPALVVDGFFRTTSGPAN